MQHNLQAITVQQVEVEDPNEPIKLRPSEPRITAVGCSVCGMVLDEALEVPCPGRSVKAMVNEWGDGLDFPSDENK
jgi:hypothetical protein